MTVIRRRMRCPWWIQERKKKQNREAEPAVTEWEVKGLRHAYRKNVLRIKKQGCKYEWVLKKWTSSLWSLLRKHKIQHSAFWAWKSYNGFGTRLKPNASKVKTCLEYIKIYTMKNCRPYSKRSEMLWRWIGFTVFSKSSNLGEVAGRDPTSKQGRWGALSCTSQNKSGLLVDKVVK